ncbi:PREDICTED: dnaJ homolog subfamily C member 30-like [Dinoponera quadriceps]|uniref:DnaJ homolog subfamily C member 30-like n=1 Tax=Dinoponera quadriceps TaxID=609295 RepID=A0A6P3Y6R1_DINQU|nr:PREDICTED: dnaJ homolog subfamily C member 30-like [Dinoponera quadriceps]XP_014486582.1 PREDICTED: dnaJ homolog subfamily C member 30-like [Dinoponera quadriceps]
MNIVSQSLCDTCQYLGFYKHAVITRFLFKYIPINSSKLLARLYSKKRDIKRKNYYDALEITPKATQSEIKSAYYMLSLQYHPDKNNSDYAKQKFQDISDAYEVLSNHEQRKNYDRHMMIHQQPVINVRESAHGKQIYTGVTKIYNFDAWTREHYGRQFEKDRIRRENYRQYKKTEEIVIQKKEKHSPFTKYIIYFLTLIFMIALHYIRNDDVPVHKAETYKK